MNRNDFRTVSISTATHKSGTVLSRYEPFDQTIHGNETKAFIQWKEYRHSKPEINPLTITVSKSVFDDHDKPERAETVQTIWTTGGDNDPSFCWNRHCIAVHVVIPFGWELKSDPEAGVVYQNLYGTRFDANIVLYYARKNQNGFRMNYSSPT